MEPPVFSAAARGGVLDRLASRTYDLLVIGGGITGAGVALDAVARGLSVALVEREDLASGTSSKSSKLIHGGLRYLQHGDIAIVRESVAERDLLLRLAPHLVQRQTFVMPHRNGRERALTGVALTMYAGLSGFGKASRFHRLSPAQLSQRAPGMVRYVENGAWEYGDCRTDDARLTMTVARTAAGLGADVVTHAEVAELRRSAGGRVVGAGVRDRLTGAELDVTAKVTLSATGVWADRVRDLAGPSPLHLLPSKGVHLVFPAADVQVSVALIIPSGARDGRRVFVIPWEDQVIVGTTDMVYEGPLESPSVEAADAEYCCTAVNKAFGTALTPDDAVGAWAGLRPLPRADAKPGGRSDTLSRRHALLSGPPGLITVTGGKLTTYRHMAADAVDLVVAELGGSARCSTAGIPLGLRGDFAAAVDRAVAVCRAAGVDPDLAQPLVMRHGDEAVPLIESAAADGSGGADRLVPHLPYIRAELAWAVDHELALSVDDVLRRRLLVGLRDAAAGGALAQEVGALLARRLGWDDATRDASVDEYRRRVAQERGVVPLVG
jgi:glycerol-3-phosphate dehydrogenase